MLNGELLAADAVRISPLADGFMFGLGLFETIKVLGGAPVFFPEHFERLRHGSAVLGLALSTPKEELLARCIRCLTANQTGDGGLKIVLFQDEGRVSELIATQPAKYPAALYLRGFNLQMVRDDGRDKKISGLKTLNHLKSIGAKRAAVAAGFDEALFVDDRGAIFEGATSNIFVVKDGAVFTPTIDQGILPGIVRAQVIRNWGEGRICEGMASSAQLRDADEVFVTNSLLGVMPVARVDAHSYDLGENPVTRSVMEMYRALELRSAAKD